MWKTLIAADTPREVKALMVWGLALCVVGTTLMGMRIDLVVVKYEFSCGEKVSWTARSPL